MFALVPCPLYVSSCRQFKNGTNGIGGEVRQSVHRGGLDEDQKVLEGDMPWRWAEVH